MEIPSDLYGKEYLEGLRFFRAQSFGRLPAKGQRWDFAGFSFGQVEVEWPTEAEGQARLADRGLRFGETALEPFYRRGTRLKLIDSLFDDQGTRLLDRTFNMNLANGDMRVTQSYLPEVTLAAFGRRVLSNVLEHGHDIQQPTDEDRILIWNEMQRGATLWVPSHERENYG